MWGLRDLRHARVKKSPLWIWTYNRKLCSKPSISPRPRYCCATVNCRSGWGNTMWVIQLLQMSQRYIKASIWQYFGSVTLGLGLGRRRVPKLSKRRPAWGERRATQKVEWAIQSWRTAGKKLDKHGFATHRTRACARVCQHHTLHFYNPIVLN